MSELAKKSPKKLTDLVVEEVSLVKRPAIQRTFVETKEANMPKDESTNKAVWDTAYINSLPDAAFAYIAPGGTKDEEGKTVPRALRYFPHHNEKVTDPNDNETVDIPHLRNALARVPQSNLDDAAKKEATDHLMEHAKALLETYQMQADVKAAVVQAITEAKELLDAELLMVQLATETTEKADTNPLPEDVAVNLEHIAGMLTGVVAKYKDEQATKGDQDGNTEPDTKPETKEGAPVHEAEVEEKIAAIKALVDKYLAAIDAKDFSGAYALLDELWGMQWDAADANMVVSALAKGLRAEIATTQEQAKEQVTSVTKEANKVDELAKQVEGLTKALNDIKEQVQAIEATPKPSKANKELGGNTTEHKKSLFKGVI